MLCEFRARLAENGTADWLLKAMLERLSEAGLLKAGGRQRTDATHVLTAVRFLSRLELVGETLRAALEELAEAAPDWLTQLIAPEWGKRYGRRVKIGKGQTILAAAWAPSAPPHLRLLPQRTRPMSRRSGRSSTCGRTTTSGSRRSPCTSSGTTTSPSASPASGGSSIASTWAAFRHRSATSATTADGSGRRNNCPATGCRST